MNKMVSVKYYPRDLKNDPKPYDPIDAGRDESVKDYRFQIDPSQVNRGYNYALLIPPMPIDGRYSYHKFVSECLVNVLADFRNSMRPNLLRPASSVDPLLTEHLLNADLLDQFRAIIGILQYMVHSSSWQAAGPYRDFDRAEINKRLEWAKVRMSP